MNEWTALHTFWSSFGIPAYDENTVPEDATMPYITYEASVADYGDKISLMGSLWYRSMSWQGISEKTKEIDDFIVGGAGISYGTGRLWITKGSPFAERMTEPDDNQVRRMLIHIQAEIH